MNPLPYPERLNAAVELLAHDGVAVRGPAGDWSYDELRARAGGYAAALGIEPGTRVLLHAANSPAAIAAWLGILRAGGIVVATMPLLRAGELAKVIGKAHVTHALVDGALAGEVAKAGELAVQALEDIAPADFDPVDTGADDVAIIAFTSGTTGVPKGCVHFHRDLLATCDTFAREILDPQPGEVFSGTPPLAFTFGLGGLVLFPLRFGASTAPVARPGPEPVLQAIRERGITTLFTAPTAYRALLRAAQPDDLASLRTCVSAGEPLPAGVAEAWHERTGDPHRRRDRVDRDAAHLHRRAGGGGPRPARAGGRCRATRRGSSGRSWRRSRPARSAGSPSAGRPAAATWTTSASRSLRASTAGTSPATRSARTRTATSGSRRAPTT